MNSRNALIGALVAAVCTGAYDEYQIVQLKAQLAYTESQLRLARAAPTPRFSGAQPPSVSAAIAARDALWARTRERTPECDQPANDDAASSCSNAYNGAYRRFLDAHPLTQFLDTQQP